MKPCRAVFAAFVLVMAVGAGAAAQTSATLLLERYETALALAPTPPAAVFDYTVSQAGLTNIEQSHRIYRQGQNERDETVMVDGLRVVPPSIQLFRQRVDHYALSRIAPHGTDYAFRFLRRQKSGKRFETVFAVTSRRARNFQVESIAIDELRALPTMIRFAAHARGWTAIGTLAFGPAGGYWVPLVATANAKSARGFARERITFSGYSFPKSLPNSTFLPPRPLASANPSP